MWSPINKFFNAAFDLFLWPFSSLPMFWQVLALALPATVVALLAFRYTSDQAAIKLAKNKIKAHLLELLLFKDDLHVIWAAQGRILRYVLKYMRHGLTPMFVMIIPFLIILIQVESRFAHRGLRAEQSTILTVSTDDVGSLATLDPAIKVPPGLETETPALRVDSTGEVHWRIKAHAPGVFPIEVTLGGETSIKTAVVGDAMRLSPVIYRANDIRALGYPAETSLAPKSTVSAIHLDYPRAGGHFIGLSSASWLLFGLCMLLGLLLRGRFGVTF